MVMMKRIPEIYTVEEVAEALRLHPYTIRRLCREGRIPGVKFGRQWRFEKKQLEELILKYSKRK